MFLVHHDDGSIDDGDGHPDRPNPKEGEREREFDLKRARSFSFVLPLTACHQDGLRIRLEQKTITPLG
jgi:hypothetical protein